MQFGLLGVLLGLPNGAMPQGQGEGAPQGGAAGLFAALLGDLGSGQQQQGQQMAASSEWMTRASLTRLAAQEITDPGAQEALGELADLLNQDITPDQADQLLEQLESMAADIADSGADQQEILEHLRQALAQIKDSKQPQKLGELIAQLPAMQATTSSETAQRPAVVERLLALMKGALQNQRKAEESPQDVAVEDVSEPSESSIAQSLQASLFRAADSAASETSASEEEIFAREYVEIVPLNAEQSMPVWVRHLGQARSKAELDAAIPPLTNPAQEAAMPDVELPRLQTAVNGSADKGIALPDFAALREQAIAANSTSGAASSNDSAAQPLHASHLHSAPRSDSHGVQSLTTHQQLVNHAPVAEQVQVAIQRGVKDGMHQMTIQLEPADLGRVEVQVRTGHDGQTQLSFLVDKADTLDSLARDARSLERALQESGVKADAGNMQFNLRQQAQPGQDGDGQFSQRQPHGYEENDTEGTQVNAAAIPTNHYTLSIHDGVDIRA